MEQIIEENNAARITYDASKKLGCIIWKSQPTPEEYKGTFNTLHKFQENNLVHYFYSDITDQGVIAPAERKWLVENVARRAHEMGTRKAATKFDGDIFKKYYLNTVMKLLPGINIPFRFFTSEKEAMDWLLD